MQFDCVHGSMIHLTAVNSISLCLRCTKAFVMWNVGRCGFDLAEAVAATNDEQTRQDKATDEYDQVSQNGVRLLSWQQRTILHLIGVK